MKLNVKGLANAAAIVAAGLFTLCALLVILAPQAARSLALVLFHLDPNLRMVNIGWWDFLGGLLLWIAGGWVIAGAAGWLYNRSQPA